MKYSNFLSFWKHLQAALPNHTAPLYAIAIPGEEERVEIAERTAQQLKKKEGVVTRLEETELSALGEALEAYSLFTSHKVVVLTVREAFSKPLRERLEQFCLSPNPAITLVIALKSMDQRLTLYRKLEAVGVIFDGSLIKGRERERQSVDWLNHLLATSNKTLSPTASQLLLSRFGDNWAALARELEKMICYSGKEPLIDETAVRALLAPGGALSSWQLPEKILSKEGALAAALFRELLFRGESLFSLLAQLRHQFALGLSALEGGEALVQKRYPYLKGERLQRRMALFRRYGQERLRYSLLAVDRTEVMAKNLGSAISQEQLAELLVWRLLLV